MSDEKSNPVRGGPRQPQDENEGNLNPEDNMETSSESSSSNPLSDPENVDHQKRESDEPAGPVAGCSENNPLQSPQPSNSAPGVHLPNEGAVGGQMLEEQSGALLNSDEDLRSRCAYFDGNTYSGKQELMRRYMNNNKIVIHTLPDVSPLGNLQTPDSDRSDPDLLNQARAIADAMSRAYQRNGNDVAASGINGQPVGFGSRSANHIGEVYPLPVTRPDTTSSREMSSSSLPQSSSECYDRRVPPLQLPGFREAFGDIPIASRRKIASDSTSDSGNRQKAEQPRHNRRKRSAADRPAMIPSGESGFAGSEGSDHKKPRSDHDYSATAPAPDSNNDENSPDGPASEDTESYSMPDDIVQPPPVNEANPPGQPRDQEPIGESGNEEDADMDVSALGGSKNGEKRQSDES